MADADGILENKEKDFGIGIPVTNQSLFLEGLDNCDWGVLPGLNCWTAPLSPCSSMPIR